MGGLVSFIGMQAVWFACVPGAAHGYGLLGPLAGAVWLGLFAWKSGRPREIVIFALRCCLIGTLLDGLLTWFGIIDPLRFYFPFPLPPLWLLTLWCIMPTLIVGNFSWLFGRYRLASFLGAVGGPAAYYGGYRLGARIMAEPLLRSLLVLGLGWAVAFPMMIYLANRRRA